MKKVELNKRLSQTSKLHRFQSLSAGTVILLFIILSIFSLLEIKNIKTHYSLTQFQPKHHDTINIDQQIKNDFQTTANNPYVISLTLSKNKGLWTSPSNLKRLDHFTQKVEENDNILYVASLSNIKTAITDKDSFTIGTINELASTKKLHILKNKLLTPHVISKDGKHAAVIITPDVLSTDQHKDLISFFESTAKELGPSVTMQLGGPAAFTNKMTALLPNEVMRFSLLSLFVSILILVFMFRGYTPAFMCLGMIVIGNLISLASLALFDLPLTVLSNTVPIIVTITVVAITTHSLVKLSEQEKNKKSKASLIYGVFSKLIGPHLLTAVTTAIGFGTLIKSDVPVISNYGLSVSICVLIACLTTLLLLPTLQMFLPMPQKRQWKFSPGHLVAFILKEKKPLIIGIFSLLIVCTGLGLNLNNSALLFDDLPKNHETRIATEFADANLGGTVPLDIRIGDENMKDPWKRPSKLKKLNQLTAWLRKQEGVGSVVSVSDFIKASQKKNNIPKTKKAISEIYFIYSMGAENPLEKFLTPNGRFTRVSLRMRDIPSDQMLGLAEKIKTKTQTLFPKMDVQVSGAATVIHTINRELAYNLMFGFFEALLWIVLLLAIVFRSFTWALISVIPNLLPPALLLGTLALTQTPIKPSIAIIFSISLGLAFDNTVYILMRLKQLMKSRYKSQVPVRKLLYEELAPCFVSSFSLMMGFSIFLFSYFSMNKIFGAFMLVSICAGLLGDLVLLPALISLRPGLLSFSVTREILIPTMRVIRMLPNYQKASAGFVIAFIILFGINKAQAAKTISAQSILDKIQKNNDVPNEKAEIKMLIKEPDGSTKERHLVIKKKNADEKKALVKLLEPADLKGVGLLTVSKDKNDETQWIYLPSEKRPRRIVASNKNGRFLDSDLSYEDLSATTYQNFDNQVEKVLKKGKGQTAIIVSSAKDKDSSSYGKIKTWVDLTTYKILKSEYYDHKGKLVKKMKFNKYKKYGSVWRAGSITVDDVRKHRSTILELKKVSLKTIKDGELSMSALEEGV